MPPPASVEPAGAVRYDFDIDVTDDSSHSRVLRAVGEGCRVLELGAAGGAMTRRLREQGCSVTVVEVDVEAAAHASGAADAVVVADLDAQLLYDVVPGRFDVVIAADVLEHLADPLRTLRAMDQMCDVGGRVIVSVPNVAHASVRLALLAGRWDYTEQGLLDRTHIRFFTRASLLDLFGQAGVGVERVECVVMQPEEAEIDLDPAVLESAAGREALAAPDGLTYQFVVVGKPRRTPGERPDASAPAPVHLRGAQAATIARQREELAQAASETADLAARLADVRAQLESMTVERDGYRDGAQFYRNELERLRATRVWVLADKARHVRERARALRLGRAES